MTDGPMGSAADPADAGVAAEPMVELRTLLLSPEQRQIAALRRQLDDPTQFSDAVAGVLAEAIVLRAGRDDALRRALAPLVAELLEETVRRDPAPVARAISPVIGPAIRRAARAALESMTHTLNHVLTRALSPRAIGWRWEAWRTGRPFAEVVMLHTLVYRVERVLLVHRETGLLLREASAPGIDASDGDVIAGMMTATSDFMDDAFGADPDDATRSVAVGDLAVWVEQGPHASLAAVVRGTAPMELRVALSEGIEVIHARMGRQMEEFIGETGPFSLLDDVLEGCLESEYR